MGTLGARKGVRDIEEINKNAMKDSIHMKMLKQNFLRNFKNGNW